MATCIIINRADGGVSIMKIATHVTKIDQSLVDKWTDSAEAHWLPVQGWRAVDTADMPARDEYRDAWRYDGKAIVHDMRKARSIHRDRIRARREKMFAELTVEQERTSRRDEAKLDAIEARRQRLRDAPADPRIDEARSIEELRAIDPLEEK